jgi:hypothetical protein
MPYLYHVFISYRRYGEWPQWVGETFLPLFKTWLAAELGADAEVSFDQKMETGVAWPNELGVRLARSCVLVPLLTKQYFSSAWCTTEWALMRAREEQYLPWVREFVSRFDLWLGEDLTRDPRIFMDSSAITAGTSWPEKLREALVRSRCLVPMLTPSYFRSDWCLMEWQSFRAREKLTGAQLIVPLLLAGGEHLPRDAQKIQWVDLRDSFSTTPVFWETKQAYKLEDRMKQVSKRVADVIRQAPPFSPDWPVVDAPRVDEESPFPSRVFNPDRF